MAPEEEGEPVYFTPRHLLAILRSLDVALLDMPLLLVHGKDLDKPNLVQGFVPAAVSVDRNIVQVKAPSLLMLANLSEPPPLQSSAPGASGSTQTLGS